MGELTGPELKALMVARGVRQGDVAVKLGYDESSLSKFLSGARTWPEDFAANCERAINEVAREKAAQLLGVDVSDLEAAAV